MNELYEKIKKVLDENEYIDVTNKCIEYSECKIFDNFIPEFARKLDIKYHYMIYIDNKHKINVYVNNVLNENTLKILIHWLKFFYIRYSDSRKFRERIFYIGLFNEQREFEIKNGIIPKHQINGGATYKYRNYYDVYIYRLEEFERLLIHECIHAFDIDEYLFTNNETYYFSELFNQGDIFFKFKEFYCHPYLFEIFTQTLSICFIIFNNVKSTNQLKSEVHRFLNHLLPIMNKIIVTFNEIGCYKEETSILSYYFGVCFLLYNIDNFCYFLLHYSNRKYINKEQFIKDFKKICIDGKRIYLQSQQYNLSYDNSLKLTPTV